MLQTVLPSGKRTTKDLLESELKEIETIFRETPDAPFTEIAEKYNLTLHAVQNIAVGLMMKGD